jgi:pimeloyl-ACP methyl ester carboxylesterase
MLMSKFILTLAVSIASSVLFASHALAENVLSSTLHTKDNVTIAYDQYKDGFDTVIIVCPGYYNSKANRWMRKTVEILSSKYDVIVFDFRGHGMSGGRYTWSAKEDIDVDAVLDYARSQGYRHIGIVAFSLGAAAAVNSVASRDNVDSMVLISCPSSFRMIDFHFWEPEMFVDLKDNIECKWEGKGARACNILLPKKDPIDTIKNIKHAAILLIAGDKDWVIKDHHSKMLYTVATEPKKLEIIKGGGHAERLIQAYPQKMKDLILGWLSETIKTH